MPCGNKQNFFVCTNSTVVTEVYFSTNVTSASKTPVTEGETLFLESGCTDKEREERLKRWAPSGQVSKTVPVSLVVDGTVCALWLNILTFTYFQAAGEVAPTQTASR